jgi:hypothetical protein
MSALMVEIIAEEVRSRIAAHDDDPLDPTWASRVAELQRTLCPDSFKLRPRAAGRRRARSLAPSGRYERGTDAEKSVQSERVTAG